jgi:hypothetical protein
VSELSKEQMRYLADALLRAWQEGMRNEPKQWVDFEREAVQVGLYLLNFPKTEMSA